LGQGGASGGAGAWSVAFGELIPGIGSKAMLLNWVQNLVVDGPMPSMHVKCNQKNHKSWKKPFKQ
jgi:hypothetical protein